MWLAPSGKLKPSFTKGRGEAAQTIRHAFSEGELAVWRVRVLNALGAPAFALRALDEADGILDRSFAKIQRARSFFHAGKYKTSARIFMGAMKEALRARRWIIKNALSDIRPITSRLFDNPLSY